MEDSNKIEELIARIKEDTIKTKETLELVRQTLKDSNEMKTTTATQLAAYQHVINQLQRPEETQKDETPEAESNHNTCNIS